MKKLLVLAPFSEVHIERIAQAAGEGWQVVQQTNSLAPDELAGLLSGADAVVGEPEPQLLVNCGERLELVQLTWAGYDKYVQVLASLPSSLTICNASGAFGKGMSQYVLAQTLGIMQNLPQYGRNQAAYRWADAGPTASLDGANVLVFGAGDIGSWVARRFAAFGCSVTGVCRNVSHGREGFERLVTIGQAQDLLPWADVVVGCLPASAESSGYLDATRLSLMKRGAVLVNVGRGSFVDCDALAQCLERGQLRGAALDVTNPEPLPSSHPLWQEERCVITPHVSGASFGHCEETEELLCQIVCENLKRLNEGEPLRNAIR